MWWSCTTLWLAGGDKRTIRSYVSRIARQTFISALEKKGFRADGRRIEGCEYDFDLEGTLQLSAQPVAMLKKKFAEVERHMDNVVERLIQRIQRNNGKRR